MVSRVKRKPLHAAGMNKRSQQRQRLGDAKQLQLSKPPTKIPVDLAPSVNQSVARTKFALGGIWLTIAVWAYWPLILELVATWQREPDYSHGFLVVPLALGFLWV